MSAISIQDPRYLEKRNMAYQYDMKMFSEMLLNVYSKMPPLKRISKNNDIEDVILPEYQEKIDEIMKKRNEFVRTNYPEFYTR